MDPCEHCWHLFQKEFSVLGQLQILHTLVKRDGKHTEFLGGVCSVCVLCVVCVIALLCMCVCVGVGV